MIDDEGTLAIDRHFGRLMARLAKRHAGEVEVAARRVSEWRAQGHVCLPLEELEGEGWEAKLRASGVVGRPGERAPLILDDRRRLYLQRYWTYEQSLSGNIRRRLSAPGFDARGLAGSLERLFPDERARMQKQAARTTLTGRFCVISGGPGTGKTRTVAAILALLIEESPAVRVALAAPTGKAAARLTESIRAARATLACPAAIREAIPEAATTVHRLLGPIPDSPRFRHDARHPLAIDAVIVDEASMVDLALMARLLDAVPPGARVVLLGDKDQLASVEAGYVLGDICHAGAPRPVAGTASGIERAVVELTENFRFASTSGIFGLSQAIQRGDADAALELLGAADVSSHPTPEPAALRAALEAGVLAGYRKFLETPEPGAALAALSKFRVLCALRRGPYGVANLNAVIEQILEDAGLLRRTSPWYSGRPVMITRNDHGMKLFNGDIGIALPDLEAAGELRVFFPAEEGERRFVPQRLPAHETAFAMTVHKSQGSEFDRALLLLPDEDARVLTRELVYTAITRARSHVEVRANADILRAALGRTVTRTSGLRDALWEERRVGTASQLSWDSLFR